MYLMGRVEASMTEEARAVAGSLLDAFRSTVAAAGVPNETCIQEGPPLVCIPEDARYSDLLVIGKEPHFHYAHPTETPISLAQLIRQTVGSVLIVPDRHREVRRGLVAFDGSAACVRSLRGFLHLKPFGTGVSLDIVNVHRKGARAASQLILQQLRMYVQKHGFRVDIHSVVGTDAGQEIVRCAVRFRADLIVAGAQFVQPLSKLAFGSTTASLLDTVAAPMWVEN